MWAYANTKFKISIANIQASTDPNNLYGTFEVQVRRFSDTDQQREVLESYPNCSLDPNSSRYVANLIGDYKVSYNFDSVDPAERRLMLAGNYPNKSSYIRIQMNPDLHNGNIPTNAMPFGFRGVPVLKTTDSLTDSQVSVLTDGGGNTYGYAATTASTSGIRMAIGAPGLTDLTAQNLLTASIVPPLPFRFKCTKGDVKRTSPAYSGDPGASEAADSRLYWGVKFERCPLTASVTNAALNTNQSTLPNPLITAYFSISRN